jgi:aerobic carbon-monoxide dehydrogenase medium subunit
MKAAAFDYGRPEGLAAALAALAEDGTRPIAGGQSLGPMLNLRLARPAAVVDIRRMAELRGAREEPGAVVWGAATTHAEVEDGRVPDPTGGALRAVAVRIAFRAVRNRGTVGGSLCHADPAADWPSALALAGAEAVIAGPSGRRAAPVSGFVRGPFEPALEPGEVLVELRIPRSPAGTRFGWRKMVRKTGEFAQAIAGIRRAPDGALRVVLGAIEAPPLLFEGPAARAAAASAIGGLSHLPAARRAILRATLDRAAAEASA